MRDLGGVEHDPLHVQLLAEAVRQCVASSAFQRGLAADHLFSALDLTNHLPVSPSLSRWHAEPLQHIFLPATSFIPNAKGYPVLSRSVQGFLKSVFKVRAGMCRSLSTEP